MSKVNVIPTITVSVDAQAWPQGHVARIASMRVGTGNVVTKNKIHSEIFAQ